MSTGVLLQARIGSTRLPKKALLPLAGATVLEHVFFALKGISVDVHALVTDEESHDLFRPLALPAGFEVFVGPAEDVLARYCMAAEYFKLDTVVRATGDNPLVSSVLANKIITIHRARDADLSRFTDAPLGTGVEVVETRALQEAKILSDERYDHEHVTPYLLRNPDTYRIVEIPVPEQYRLPKASVTLDTPDDYRYIISIFSALYREKPVTIEELVVWLKNTERFPQEG